MATKPKYRLEVLVTMKDRARRAAEVELARAIIYLNEQREKLKELEKKKTETEEKIETERREMADRLQRGEALMKDPQTHLNYIQKYKDDLVEIEEQIEAQKRVITQAERRVKRTRANYMVAAQEHNMMLKHRELWQKKLAEQLTAQENKLLNEIGNVIHQMTKAGMSNGHQ